MWLPAHRLGTLAPGMGDSASPPELIREAMSLSRTQLVRLWGWSGQTLPTGPCG